MHLLINGRDREFDSLDQDPRLTHLVELLQLKPDRIAIEHNGEIVARSAREGTTLHPGDKLEIVQFVGGGC
ncbi:MAG: sulfur carrier protein ThiS [Acidobacteriaceae bacterium]